MAAACGSVDPRKVSNNDCLGYGMRLGSGPDGWLAATAAEFGGGGTAAAWLDAAEHPAIARVMAIKGSPAASERSRRRPRITAPLGNICFAISHYTNRFVSISRRQRSWSEAVREEIGS